MLAQGFPKETPVCHGSSGILLNFETPKSCWGNPVLFTIKLFLRHKCWENRDGLRGRSVGSVGTGPPGVGNCEDGAIDKAPKRTASNGGTLDNRR